MAIMDVDDEGALYGYLNLGLKTTAYEKPAL